MIIAAFDVATITGVCDGTIGSDKPRLWSWHLADAGESRPQRLLMLDRFLRKYFEQEPCDRVVYEAPMPLGAIAAMRGMSEANVAFLRGAIGVVEKCCAEFNKPVEALSVQDARGSVLGWRINRSGAILVQKRDKTHRAETTKERVMREVRSFFKVDAQNDNEADAYVLWRFACNRANPGLALASTPLFAEGETR